MADPVVHITNGLPDLGTGNITTLGLTIPPAGSTTSGIQGGPMVQGAVTTGAPSYTNGLTNPLSLTTSGGLRVDGSAVTQPVSLSGTVTVTGTITANQGGAPWTMKPDGTAWTLTSTSANVNVTNTVPVSGTFFQATQPISAVSLPLPTGAATAANQITAVGAGSTTTGQTGGLTFGAVTTAAPTYTTGQSDPLSITTAGALRVDGSGVTQPVSGTISVSGTVPVSGTITANQGGTWTVQPGNTANTTAWLVTGTGGTFPATQSGNWTSRIVGNVGAILDFAGQNAAAPANSILVGAEFNTTPTTLASGNASPLQLDSAGNLLVNVKAGGAAGGTSSSFGVAFPGTGTAAGAEYLSSPPTLTSGQMVALQTNVNGALKIDGSAVTQPISGTVTVTQSTAASLNATVTGTVAATQSGNWTTRIVGNAGATLDVSSAQNQTMPTNILVTGGEFNSTATAITSGNCSPLQVDKVGRLLTVAAIRATKAVQKTSISVATETTVVTAGAAGVFNDVYAIVVTNKSATAVFVDFRDATAGTVRMTLAAPAGDTRGFTVTVDSAMVQATAANNWTATVSSAVSSIEITMLYVSNL